MRLRLLLIALVLALPGAAQARTAAITPDIPSGFHAVAPHVAQANPANLSYQGGDVLHFNRTHLIFWTPKGSGLEFSTGYISLIERFLQDVAADSRKQTNVYSLSGQYTDGLGHAVYNSTYGGAVMDTDALPSNGCTEPPLLLGGPGWSVCLTDAQIQQEIEHVVKADRLPTGSTDIYFLITPDGFGSCLDSSSSACALGGQNNNGYCSYHFETQNAQAILYAVIPYPALSGHCQSSNPRPNGNPADLTVSYISHEHNETVTDPHQDAWIDSSGNEDGDLCLQVFGPRLGGSGNAIWNEVIHGDHYYLQEEWSNYNSACEPRAPFDRVAFGVPRRISTRGPAHLRASARDPEGSIVFYGWFFGDGSVGHGRRPSHQFRRAGRYRVVLRTTDNWGNWAYSARWVTVFRR